MSSGKPYRITYFTAGAAGMYCGSCMHDNTLARALMQLGCDVQLLPLYTPIRTDETSVAADQIFFGGINMYLQQKYAFFRMLPPWLDRWINASWLIRWATSRGIQTQAESLGALAVSVLQGEEGHQKKEVLRLINWLETQPIPDIFIFTNMLVAGCLPLLKRKFKRPVIVTLQGDDIFLNELPAEYRLQALAEIKKLHVHIDGYFTNSHFYADYMADLLAAPREKFHVIPLGIDTHDFVPLQPEQKNATQLTLGYLARLAPEKGLHVLIDAFIFIHKQLHFQNLRLRIAGWLGKQHIPYVQEQKQKLVAANLTEYVDWVGEVTRSEKTKFLASLDLLSVPTVYCEPKGLFVLEAFAMGIPVIVPQHGTFPELLAEIPAGLLFPPNNAAALAQSIVELLSDKARLEQFSQIGREKVTMLRNATAMAQATLQTCKQLSDNVRL
jgi:glycosyltransferase involved in cell wall biosynthesis